MRIFVALGTFVVLAVVTLGIEYGILEAAHYNSYVTVATGIATMTALVFEFAIPLVRAMQFREGE